MGIIIDQRKERYKDVWLEKHRPSSLDSLVMNNDHKRKFKEMIEDDCIPNLLFLGSAGTGKTTLAYILLDSVIHDYSDYLEMNGSLKRGIGMINNLDDFIKSETFLSKKKVIFIDEADKLTPDAQDALRNLIEQNADHLSFIFTANYAYKISDAIQSRMQTYRFERLPKDYVQKHVYDIMDKEAITYQKGDVDYIINATFPDLRKCLNEINKVVYRDSSDGKILSLGNAGNTFLIEQKFLENLINIANAKATNSDPNPFIREAYAFIDADNMDYLLSFEKIYEHFRTIGFRTLTSKFYNEVGKVISPKYLMAEYLGEFLKMVLR